MEDITGIEAGELPGNEGTFAVDLQIPGTGVSFERSEVGEAALAQALTGEEPDFDFRLVQPTTVLECVVDREGMSGYTGIRHTLLYDKMRECRIE